MYQIGAFSKLAKTTVKTLRYYEKEGLLMPSYVDQNTNYRYYESKQLVDLAKIIALRQLGLSINMIKEVIKTNNSKVLFERKKALENEIDSNIKQLAKITYLLEGKEMEYEVINKKLPDYTVYYKEGVIEDFSKLVEFILSSSTECLKTNPDIKCIEPDYCYVSYLDPEYKDKNIKIRYAQAVEKEGIPNDSIKFEKLKSINSVCVYHKGSYANMRDTYNFILQYIEKNGLEIIEPIRERYIDGMWNKENEEDWLTEIQVPIK